MFRSADGGKTFELMPARHGDHHGLWIDPKNPQRIANTNDGGASVSTDGGKTWTTQNNQPTAQFYHVSVDNAFPYHIYGAQQDNSSVGIASRTDEGVISRAGLVPSRRWRVRLRPGRSARLANHLFEQRSLHHVATTSTPEQYQDISVWPLDNSGHGAEDLVHRFQWVSPLILSPHNPDTIYTAGEAVFRSTDHGQTWTPDQRRSQPQ